MNTHVHFKIINYVAIIIIFFLEALLFQWAVNGGLILILSYFNIYFSGISYLFSIIILIGIQTISTFFLGENQLIQASKNIKYVENYLDKQFNVPELANTYIAFHKILLELLTTVVFILLTNIIL